jgi:hypothetical protein
MAASPIAVAREAVREGVREAGRTRRGGRMLTACASSTGLTLRPDRSGSVTTQLRGGCRALERAALLFPQAPLGWLADLRRN